MHNPGCWFLAVVLCLPAAQIETLTVGSPLKRELRRGEVHSYKVDAAPRTYVHATIEQDRVDLSARLVDGSGQAAVEVENATGENEPLFLSTIAPASGALRLEIRLRGQKSAVGSYQVRLDDLRAPTPMDEKRMAAERRGIEGDALRARGSGDSQRAAILKYEAAAPLWQSLRDWQQEARTHLKIGEIYADLGLPKDALPAYEQALSLRRRFGDRGGESEALSDLGLAYKDLAELEKALAYLNESLPLRRALGNVRGEAITLNNIATVYSAMGELNQALDHYSMALPLWRATGSRDGEAITLTNMGVDYSALGDSEKALDYHQQALAILKLLGIQRQEAHALNNIGFAYRSLDQIPKALEYYEQALKLRRTVGDRRGEAQTLWNMGHVYSDLRQTQKAREYFEQVLLLRRATEDRHGEALALTDLGTTDLDLGQSNKALEHVSQAVTMLKSTHDRNQPWALSALARVHRALGDLAEARRDIENAIQMTESVRGSMADQDLRSSYLATTRGQYDLLIGILVGLHHERPGEGFDAQALEVSERARARSLLDLLGEARIDIREGVDSGLLARERSLRTQLNAKVERQIRILSGDHTAQQTEAIEEELRALTAEYQETQARIRATSPRYAAVMQPQPLTRSQIQKDVLDQDTILLEYALGEERSFVWAVTLDSLSVHELPKRSEIETLARRAYQYLNSNRPGAAAENSVVLESLSRMLLTPAATRLGSKRLAIVMEGALQYIPFGALPDPSVPGQPLLVKHEIVSLPSASTLAVLRRESRGRNPVPKALAVLADPVFHPLDPRVGHAVRGSAPSARPPESVERSASESGLLSFDRLQASRREAESIAALLKPTDVFMALDFDASRTTALSEKLSQYRIVHFATHGLLNSLHPGLSGLVFSLVDPAGRAQNGFLEAHEIYNSRLGADLVVLSACQTALGKDIRGEGLIGMTRGFMYAGAPRVVASLWSVPDRSTSELMVRFYRGMFTQRLTPAAALRAAQVAMWREKRWTSPYYWAGFTLQGEWR